MWHIQGYKLINKRIMTKFERFLLKSKILVEDTSFHVENMICKFNLKNPFVFLLMILWMIAFFVIDTISALIIGFVVGYNDFTSYRHECSRDNQDSSVA